MRPSPRRLLALTTLAVVLSASAGSPQASDPPGPVRRSEPHLLAVALERGVLHREADVGSEEVLQFRRGAVFDYLGPSTDTFGRDWSAVGDGDSWVRTEDWYGVAASPAEVRGQAGEIAALTFLPTPEASVVTAATTEVATAQISSMRMPIEVEADWWTQSVAIDAAAIGQFGRVLGFPGRVVEEAVADELIQLLGGQEALGPFPETPVYGSVFVAARTGLVFRHDGRAWKLTDPVLTMGDNVGLLANPGLVFDDEAPPEPTGPSIACWRLVGGLGPRGEVVGTVAAAPAPPVRLDSASRPDTERYLGYYDLTPRAWPTVLPSMQAPRRVLPVGVTSGVALADNSRRQAVYLEQTLPSAVTRQLRGRQVRIALRARASLVAGSPTATVGIDVEAGTLREFTSVQVGAMSTPVELLVTVPEDAEEIVVRVLPNDLSIAVTEAASAVIDSATLVPVEWDGTLEPAPLIIRLARAITYEPAPRHTPARVVVTERSYEQVTRIMGRAGDVSDDRLEKILAGDVEVDMTEREVRLAWGDPIETAETGLTVWTWVDRTASFDEEGLLIAWTRQPEPEPIGPSICGVAAAEGR